MGATGNSRRTGNKTIFPQKLWKLVNDEQCNDVIGWNEDGASFFVNVNELKANFLGKSAKSPFHTKEPKSFVRQLHMYGFKKIGQNRYMHKFFKRHDEAAILKIKRRYPPKILGESTNILEQSDDAQHQDQDFYHNQHDVTTSDQENSNDQEQQQIMVVQPYGINGNYGYVIDPNQIINTNITYAHHVMYDYTDIDVWMTFPELTNELTLEELTSAYSRSYLDNNN